MSTLMANIFLGCFIFGLVWTVVILLFGFDHHLFDFGHHGHFDFGGHGGGHVGHVDAGHVDTGQGDASPDTDSGGGVHHLPFFNFNGIVMFLTWFGAVGYALNRSASASILITLLAAIAAGVLGAAVVFWFFNKVLMRGVTPDMREAEYQLPGTLAKVVSGIREGGVGEVVYEQGGTRKTVGARSEDGTRHKQGEEVVIVRYEKGIAYVQALPVELAEQLGTPT